MLPDAPRQERRLRYPIQFNSVISSLSYSSCGRWGSKWAVESGVPFTLLRLISQVSPTGVRIIGIQTIRRQCALLCEMHSVARDGSNMLFDWVVRFIKQ